MTCNCGAEGSIVLYGAGECPSAPGDRTVAFEVRCDRCSPPPPPPVVAAPPEPPTDYW